MRLRTIAFALAGLPMTVGGCGDSGTPGASPSAAPGAPWIVVATGSATPSPAPSLASPRTGLPSISFLPTTAAPCTVAWPTDAQVLIPMIVTPGPASLKVEWPAKYGPTYRVTAVDQRLVSGSQPVPPWKTVPAGRDCTASTTITGLTSGVAYIVWLDAPDTPRAIDGTRSLYSGKSGIVRPL